jgi:hypothetical protein
MTDEIMPGWREQVHVHRGAERVFPFGVLYVQEYTDPDDGAGWTWTFYMRYNDMLQRVARGPVTNQEGVRLVLATPEAAAEEAYVWLRALAKQIQQELP